MIVRFPTAEERARAKLTPSEIKLLDRAYENAVLAVSIVWPELNNPTDYPEDLEELAGLEFDDAPEFRTDGIGAGIPEFR